MAKYCHNCGTQLDDDAVFCAACGTRQAQPEPSVQVSAAPVCAPDAPKKKKTGLIAGVAALALAVALVLVGTLYLWPNFLSRDARYDRYMEKAASALSGEDYDAADAAYGKAIALGTGRAAPYLGRGDARLALCAYDGAAEDYRAAIALEPDEAAAYLKLADVCLAQEDEDAALNALREGLDATDGDCDISARIAELSSPFGDLSGLLGEVAEVVADSPMGKRFDFAAATSMAAAYANTAEAMRATLSASPASALGDLVSALVSGQVTLECALADGGESVGIRADVASDLPAGELSLTGALSLNGETADATVYLGTQYGAFQSDLIGADWYGVTWATLLDDLAASGLVETGAISDSDIGELRELFALLAQFGGELSALDLSGIDWKPYLNALLSVEPELVSGTDSTCREYLTIQFDDQDFVSALADCVALLGEDDAMRDLVIAVLEALDADGNDVADIRAEWASGFDEIADALRALPVSGSYALTLYASDGYLDTVVVTSDVRTEDGQVTVTGTTDYEYAHGALTAMTTSIELVDAYGDEMAVLLDYRAEDTDDVFSDVITLAYADAYDTVAIALGSEWDRASGELTIAISADDGYDETSFALPLRLSQRGGSTELSVDLAALLGVELDTATLSLTAAPGAPKVESPKRYVNLNDWDADVLDAFAAAADRLDAILNDDAADDWY